MSTKGKVVGVVANLVNIEVDGPVSQNEICYIDIDGVNCMAEVIKITGKTVFTQVFESTRGLRVGNKVDFLGKMLEVTLGPGMLSKNYDGLQNDLNKMEGNFLQRGDYTSALDEETKWSFTPLVKENTQVTAADWIGNVKEGWIDHKIMVPFNFK